MLETRVRTLRPSVDASSRYLPLGRAALAGLLIAVGVPAATPIASLSPLGHVRLGEDRVDHAAGRPIAAGDAIRTAPRSLALIRTRSSGRLEVRSDSRARLYEDRLDLESGSAASAELPIRLDEITVAPAGEGEHWFAVGEREGRTIVAAHKGSVVIRRSGARSVVVPAGSYAIPSAAHPQGDSADQTSTPNSSGRTAHPTATSNSGGWTIGSLTHGQSMLVAGGVAAVATTAVVAGVVAAGDEQPARSPSQ